MVDNVIFLADCYKSSHYNQYPPGATHNYSYFESRGGKFPYSTFFGLQYILKKWLTGPVVTREKILEAKELIGDYYKNKNIFNEEGWNYILEHHGGYLPVRICAVPEGTAVPTKNVLFTVENTDPKVPWLTGYLETVLVQCWYPMTVATISRIQKQIITKYMEETAECFDSLPLMLIDFGYRGVSTVESAGIGGLAHLVNFEGSDTVASAVFAKKYYHCASAAHSIPAAEHSTVTSWGRDAELESFRNLLTAYPSGPVSVVVDSYNVYVACEDYLGKQLKHKIIENSKIGGSVIVRPDSGDPHEIVIKILNIFEKAFGAKKNSKGFKVLPPYLKLLQGDGINYRTVASVLSCLKENGWSAENLLFGSGGALLQRVDRDTHKCAFKCSLMVIDGKEIEVFKDPITDSGKKSKRGRLTLESHNGQLVTVQHGKGSKDNDLLVPVFENGILLKDFTLDEIRAKAQINANDIDIFAFLKQDEKSDF